MQGADMKSVLCLVISLGLTAVCAAQTLGSMADVSIIDRDSGAILTPYYSRGEYWVAGRPGARYAIEIRNHLGERLLAVTSVDGVNVLSGATAAWDQEGYVFAPGEDYQITGWRKSDAEVAAFTFTASPNSYAERTGRPANVGVIGVALFRERQPRIAYAPPVVGRVAPLEERGQDQSLLGSAGAPIAAPPPSAPPPSAPQPPAPAPSAGAAEAPRASDSLVGGSARALTSPWRGVAPLSPKLGTGHGEREYSFVNHTEFLRMQLQPNEVIRIHYDSLDNLLAMGIVKRPRPLPPISNPFPGSPDRSYVPDPPG
jgi:hypothetical protein